jgi:hypothetical protein
MSISLDKLQDLHDTDTASVYDTMHTNCKTGDLLGFIEMLCDTLGLNALFDVGSDTGRSVRVLLSHGKDARGVEPVRALQRQVDCSYQPEPRSSWSRCGRVGG